MTICDRCKKPTTKQIKLEEAEGLLFNKCSKKDLCPNCIDDLYALFDRFMKGKS